MRKHRYPGICSRCGGTFVDRALRTKQCRKCAIFSAENITRIRHAKATGECLDCKTALLTGDKYTFMDTVDLSHLLVYHTCPNCGFYVALERKQHAQSTTNLQQQ